MNRFVMDSSSRQTWVETVLWGLRCLILLCFTLLGQPIMAQAPHDDIWQYFKETFILTNGRVVDFHQNAISHSEGQGYALILALEYDDKASFSKVYEWSKQHLQVRDDALFAWKWGRAEPTEKQAIEGKSHASDSWKVLDTNHATDGELLILWALLRAHSKWRNLGYLDDANNIQRDLLKATLRSLRDRWVLLPAELGFQQERKLTLNPSYLVFPAYEQLATVFSGPWPRILQDSQWLLEESQMNELSMPSDWVVWDERYEAIFSQTPFSAEAIRTWLYMSISTLKPKVFYGFEHWQGFYGKYGYYPNEFSRRNFEFEGYGMPGYWAISARVLHELNQPKEAANIWKIAKAKLLEEEKNYYSTALFLLSFVGLEQ